MGRGSRQGRKRKFVNEQGVTGAEPSGAQQANTNTIASSLDVSFWKRSSSSSGAGAGAGETDNDSTTTIPLALTADFFMNDNNNDTERAIPPPLPQQPPPTQTDDAAAAEWKSSLQQLWKGLSRRHSNHHGNNNWTAPTTVQLQAWSILLSSSAPHPHHGDDGSGSSSSTGIANHHHYNLLQISPTGSGKTYAYGLPMLLESSCMTMMVRTTTTTTNTTATTSITTHSGGATGSSTAGGGGGVSGLVLVPTRELALQVQASLTAAATYVCGSRCAAATASLDTIGGGATTTTTTTTTRIVACYGGVSKEQQRNELLLNSQNNKMHPMLIVTATPGRLLDLLQEEGDDDSTATAATIRSLFTNNNTLKTICLDEADRLAMNKDLCEQTGAILKLLLVANSGVVDTRIVLCSATWPDRATPAWDEWVTATARPCLVVKVDAMSVKTTAAKKCSSADGDAISSAGVTVVEQTTTDTATTPPVMTKSASSELPAYDKAVAPAEDGDDFKKQISKTNSSTKDLLLSRIPANLTQILHVCAEHKKPKKLLSTLDTIRKADTGSNASSRSNSNRSSGIIFFSKIKTAQYISNFLAKEKKIACAELHSHLSQPARERVLRDFTSGKVPLLLATDIAARGIHANHVTFIINYDFPGNLEQYVHRCGRAGRGGGMDVKGTVYSFFTRNLAPLAADMVALLESNNQWVDANLRALATIVRVPTSNVDSNKESVGAAVAISKVATAKNKPHPEKATVALKAASSDQDEEDDFVQDDPFKELSAKRIVLKRASHISDASDDSSDEEDSSGK